MDDPMRWGQLINLADDLTERIGADVSHDGRVVEDEMLAALNSVLEAFPKSIEPLDDFRGFAVRRLAKALREGLFTLKERSIPADLRH